MDELLAKGMISGSLIPCAILNLLVPKKDASMMICVDCRAINKIIIKYYYPIHRFEDLLDYLHGATFFSKIHLRMAATKSKSMGEISGKQHSRPGVACMSGC